MQVVSVTGEIREGRGKSASKIIRAQGGIPCVMYSAEVNQKFSVKPLDVRSLIYTPEFKLAEISLNGNTHKCYIKDVQFHPVTEEILHLDFVKLEEGRNIRLEVPVKCVGVAPGVKTGGKLQQKVRKVKIKTSPENIIDHMEVDISKLELGSSVRVRDISAVEGVSIMNSPGIPVASVETPRALRSAEAAAESEAAAEGAEGDTEGEETTAEEGN